MRTFASLVSIFLGLAVVFAGGALASEVQTEYYMTVGDYYDVPYDEVLAMVDLGISDEELPVVITVSQKSKVASEEVARLRLMGKSWTEVVSAYGLDAKSFYVLICGTFQSKAFSPTFEKFRSTSQNNWNTISLDNDEIVNLVNLRMLYSHHDYSAFNIIAMRDYERSYVKINHDVAQAKADMHKRQMAQANEQGRNERAAKQKQASEPTDK